MPAPPMKVPYGRHAPLRAGIRPAHFLPAGILFALAALMAVPARAADQWASSVIAFSSQAGTGPWSASRAVGPPDVPAYGNDGNAWMPSAMNGTRESITLGFATPVNATGVTVRETSGNGYVAQVDAIDTNNQLHTVWTSIDTSPDYRLADFDAYWARTSYLVKAVKITIDTNRDLGSWEGLDAVQLHDSYTTKHWASQVLAVSSQYGNSAAQALWMPDVTSYGDSPLAWTPSSMDGTLESITLAFPAAVKATGATIRETSGNGYVTKVDAIDLASAPHTVWTGTDPTKPGAPADFHITWAQTSYPVYALKITIDTNRTRNVWEEMDAVALEGDVQTSAAPTLSGLQPNPLALKTPDLVLLVKGQNFVPGSSVNWNGAYRPTTFVSPALLAVSLNAADVQTAGTVSITVTNPAPGGGTSAAVNLTISASLWGDVNGDGKTDTQDVQTALKIAAGLLKPASLKGDVAPTTPNLPNTNGDGRITIADALRILRALYFR